MRTKNVVRVFVTKIWIINVQEQEIIDFLGWDHSNGFLPYSTNTLIIDIRDGTGCLYLIIGRAHFFEQEY